MKRLFIVALCVAAVCSAKLTGKIREYKPFAEKPVTDGSQHPEGPVPKPGIEDHHVEHPQHQDHREQEFIPIVSQTIEANPDGSFRHTFEAGNGIIQKAESVVATTKDSESDGTLNKVTGMFQYPGPDGEIIKLSYTADENGYHPEGDHLPTPPPVPTEILRALDWIKEHVDEKESIDNEDAREEEAGKPIVQDA